MEKQIAKDLIRFIDSSPNNFFAVDTVKKELIANGFKQLFAADSWKLEKGGRYFITKNDSSVFAFVAGTRPVAEAGFKLICAHCDSPSFRIKPMPEMLTEGGVLKLNTEVYGCPILYTWFDRPLSMAGRVILKTTHPLIPEPPFFYFDRFWLISPHPAILPNTAVNI